MCCEGVLCIGLGLWVSLVFDFVASICRRRHPRNRFSLDALRQFLFCFVRAVPPPPLVIKKVYILVGLCPSTRGRRGATTMYETIFARAAVASRSSPLTSPPPALAVAAACPCPASASAAPAAAG
jgi:hypothetical protein